jgi:hypothetical protein
MFSNDIKITVWKTVAQEFIDNFVLSCQRHPEMKCSNTKHWPEQGGGVRIFRGHIIAINCVVFPA